MDLANAQRAQRRTNLARLAVHLWNLPRDYANFDMLNYSRVPGFSGGIPLHDHMRRESQHPCGTTACAAGHLPRVEGCPLPREDELWHEYISRVTGLTVNSLLSRDYVEGDREGFYWCFGSAWQNVDNTPHGAAQRIWRFLENGLPEDWMHQMTGETPLCYTEVAVPRDLSVQRIEELCHAQ